VAGHVGLELRNVVANYLFESSRRFAGSKPNSGHSDHSHLSCGAGGTQLGPGASIPRASSRTRWSSICIAEKCAGRPARPARSRFFCAPPCGWQTFAVVGAHNANYPLGRSHRFMGIQPNSGLGDYSRLSYGVGRRSSALPQAPYKRCWRTNRILSPNQPLLTLRCTFGAKRVCVARTRKPDRLDDLLAGRSDLLIAWLGRSIAKQQLPRLLNRRHGAALRDLEVKARRQTKVRPYHSAVIPGASRVGRRGWPWLLLLPSELHSVR